MGGLCELSPPGNMLYKYMQASSKFYFSRISVLFDLTHLMQLEQLDISQNQILGRGQLVQKFFSCDVTREFPQKPKFNVSTGNNHKVNKVSIEKTSILVILNTVG